MPATPIQFRITESLQASLKKIVSGQLYHYTVKGWAVKLDPDHEVERLVLGADPPAGPPRPFLVLDMSQAPAFIYDERNDRPTVVMPFTVHAFHDTNPEDDSSALLTYFSLCADVETALRTNTNHGGLAMTTLVTGHSMRMVGQEVRAQVQGRVELKRFYGSPNG
jgi:hypothetical protein